MTQHTVANVAPFIRMTMKLPQHEPIVIPTKAMAGSSSSPSILFAHFDLIRLSISRQVATRNGNIN